MKKNKTIKLTELELDTLEILVTDKLRSDWLDNWVDDIKQNQALKRVLKKLRPKN